MSMISAKTKRSLGISLLVIFTFACNQTTEKEAITEFKTSDEDTFFQYNIWWGFVNKVFDGDLTVAELKTRGDVALGSYTQLDGELVMVDGIPYRIREDGSVTVPDDSDEIVYVDAAFFKEESSFNINQTTDYDAVRTIINSELSSLNTFYAFKIHGKFNYMKCGGLNKQEKPYTDGLDVLIPNRPVFERENFEGTIIGFYCPEFIGNINVAGYHFHIISDDKKFGGHVMEFEAKELEVLVDPLLEYHFELPNSTDFMNVTLDKEFQYEKK